MSKITPKRQAWIEEYLHCWNATEAARRVGFAHPNAQGPRLLLDVSIREYIKQRASEIAMSTDEVLLRLAGHARSDMGDFLDINEMSHSLDLAKAKELGLTHLIKKVKDKTIMTNDAKGNESEFHTMEVELYDAQAALDKLARIHGMYKDNVDITSGGKVIEVVIGNKET